MSKKIELTVTETQYESLRVGFKSRAEQTVSLVAITERDVADARARLAGLEAELVKRKAEAGEARTAFEAAFPPPPEPAPDPGKPEKP